MQKKLLSGTTLMRDSSSVVLVARLRGRTPPITEMEGQYQLFLGYPS